MRISAVLMRSSTLCGKRILSHPEVDPPSGDFRGVESFLADRRLSGPHAGTCRLYEGYLRRFVHAIDKHILEVSKDDIAIVLAFLSCNASDKYAYFRVLRAVSLS